MWVFIIKYIYTGCGKQSSSLTFFCSFLSNHLEFKHKILHTCLVISCTHNSLIAYSELKSKWALQCHVRCLWPSARISVDHCRPCVQSPNLLHQLAGKFSSLNSASSFSGAMRPLSPLLRNLSHATSASSFCRPTTPYPCQFSLKTCFVQKIIKELAVLLFTNTTSQVTSLTVNWLLVILNHWKNFEQFSCTCFRTNFFIARWQHSNGDNFRTL